MIYITIPTGQRTDRAVETVQKWMAMGFHVAVYTWDSETLKRLNDPRKVDLLMEDRRRPFAVLSNILAEEVFLQEPTCDAIICGADDLWPVSTLKEIEDVVRLNPDKIIWVKDGCFNQQPTHPIVTKKWFQDHGEKIFSTAYAHNYCDTDLALRAVAERSIVKCFDIEGFDHRHWYKTGNRETRDEVYRIGERWFKSDQEIFESRFPNVNIMGSLQSVPLAEVVHAS
jgi:hypothetical protein